jgi:polyhydroxyalkanoate synthesis regulator phasin
MATKKAASKSEATQILTRLQSNMKRLQRDAEGLLGRTRKQATQLISRDQRRALDRLFSQAKKLRTDLEKRAERASKNVESRAEQFLSTLEKETSKRLSPILKRLDLPSRKDIEALSRRIGQLEKRVRTSSRPVATATPAVQAPPSALAAEVPASLTDE